MKKLIVLDYAENEVDIYDVEQNINIDYNFVAALGYKMDSCSWMCGDNTRITFHGGAIK